MLSTVHIKSFMSVSSILQYETFIFIFQEALFIVLCCTNALKIGITPFHPPTLMIMDL